MNQVLNIQELSMVISVTKQNPTIVTPDFLKSSNIVPREWEVARPPVLSQFGAQVIFQNGVSIVAQPNQIGFAERVDNKPLDDLSVATIARKYAQVLSQLDYQGIRTGLRGHLALGKENPSAAKDYLFRQLLSPQILQQQGYQPLQAAVKLTYRINDAQLVLEINEAGLIVEKRIEPVIVFSGNFTRSLKRKEVNNLAILNEIIENWRKDWDSYTSLVNDRFVSLVDRASLSASA
jgi:hypothetical protein